MRTAFAQELAELAKTNDKIVLLVGDIGNTLFDDFKKVAPDLSSVESKNETTVRYVARVPNKVETSIGWQQQHAPETKLLQ